MLETAEPWSIRRKHLPEAPTVLDRPVDDLGHRLLNDDVITVDQRDRRVGILLDAPNELGVDHDGLAVESRDCDHVSSYRTSSSSSSINSSVTVITRLEAV